MLMVVVFSVMVRMVMVMRGGSIRFMLMGMGGIIAVVGMLMFMLEGVGVVVVVMVAVAMFLAAMLVGMFMIVFVVMTVVVLVRVFTLAHGLLLVGYFDFFHLPSENYSSRRAMSSR